MGLFDFVEEDDAVGTAADGFGQLAAFIVADVSRRRPDEAGHGVFFHVFGHIDADDVPFVVKEGFGQGFGKFGLADACRAEEDERADGAVRVLDAGAGPHDGVADDLDGRILADDSFMKGFVEVEQFFPFAGEHLGDGDACPAADDLGDVFFTNLFF